MNHANYEILKETEDAIIIRDLGPWNKHPTVTNDIETVVRQLAPLLGKRRLLYYDSFEDLTEALHDGKGNFLDYKMP